MFRHLLLMPAYTWLHQPINDAGLDPFWSCNRKEQWRKMVYYMTYPIALYNQRDFWSIYLFNQRAVMGRSFVFFCCWVSRESGIWPTNPQQPSSTQIQFSSPHLPGKSRQILSLTCTLGTIFSGPFIYQPTCHLDVGGNWRTPTWQRSCEVTVLLSSPPFCSLVRDKYWTNIGLKARRPGGSIALLPFVLWIILVW